MNRAVGHPPGVRTMGHRIAVGLVSGSSASVLVLELVSLRLLGRTSV